MLASGLSVAPSARADEAGDTAAARVLGGDGLNLADAGECGQAIDKLRRAEDLHHAPTTAGRLGECEILVGHLVDGTERLQRLLREPVAPNAPTPFVDALVRARHALEKALPRIASLRVSVRVPAGTKVQLTVDGDRQPEALLDNDRPIDPGRHTIVASATGFVTKTDEVTVHDGEKGNLTLELAPDLVAQAAAREAAAAQKRAAARQAAASESSANRPASAESNRGVGLASIVAFTLGGVGLATGIVGGAIVASDASDLSKACGTNKICPADKQSELTSAKTWATVSTAGFAVAGAGLGAGLLLILLNGGHDDSSPKDQARIHPVVGPLYIGCEGAL